MVQEVESLRSKLQVDRFRYVCPLHDRNIVVRLEWTSENVPTDIANCGETGARRTAAANDYVLIVNASSGGDERIEVDEVVDSLPCAATRQDRTRTDSGPAAIDEVGIL